MKITQCCLVPVEYCRDFFGSVGKHLLKILQKNSFSQRIPETPSLARRFLRARVAIDKEHQGD